MDGRSDWSRVERALVKSFPVSYACGWLLSAGCVVAAAVVAAVMMMMTMMIMIMTCFLIIFVFRRCPQLSTFLFQMMDKGMGRDAQSDSEDEDGEPAKRCVSFGWGCVHSPALCPQHGPASNA